MRQHVNPLSRFFQLPLQLPDPTQLFENPCLPIHVDIGSARGSFLLSLAAMNPECNFLGLEIRHPLVISAERKRAQLGLTNLHFLFCNANVSLEEWLASLQKNLLIRVSIQFPDPWLKKRHQKRRVLQPSLLLSIAGALQEERELFIQSDLKEVVEPMIRLIEFSGCFNRLAGQDSEWLPVNPLGVKTEREGYVLEKGLPVYRGLFLRNKQPLPELCALEEACHQVAMTIS